MRDASSLADPGRREARARSDAAIADRVPPSPCHPAHGIGAPSTNAPPATVDGSIARPSPALRLAPAATDPPAAPTPTAPTPTAPTPAAPTSAALAPRRGDGALDPATLVPRCPDPIIRVRGLAGLIVQRPDLDRARDFFADFGLVPAAPPTADVLHLRGAGPDPVLYTCLRGPARFLGLAFTAEDAALDRLAAAERVAVAPNDAPGGGRRVRLWDPQGWQVDVIAGRAPIPCPPAAPLTAADRINTPLRLDRTPPAIRKLGHLALEVVDFDATTRWYIDRFGLIPSDVQILDDGTPALVFMRCDRGAEPADHHTLVIGRSIEARFNHAAFEVDDLDALAMGQRVLRERGWRHGWGIGRHLMGSQLFDYWRDPWGDLVEHYADGDRFAADIPAGIAAFARTSQAQWGPPMPDDFIDQRMTPRRLVALWRALRRSRELTIGRLLALKRAVR
ncbi:MAG: VOC family protein [bacterium]